MQKYAFLVFLSTILISLLMIPPTPAGASCLPTGNNMGESYQGCNLLVKQATWFISFPCTLASSHGGMIELNGTGWCASGTVCCDSTPRTTECWPLFNFPVATDGKWRVVVNNRTTSTSTSSCPGGCSAANTVTCSTLGSQAFEVLHEGGANCNHSEECETQACEAGCAFECGVGCVGSGCSSPVLIDVAGNGFALTHSTSGVEFDLDTNGIKESIAWTATTSDDAWLTLDRNGNGTIDNGAELFGNYTPQSTTGKKNGFQALAEYDKTANGGNNDGTLSASDSVFTSLRLWQDTNHNGISEPSELKSLNPLGLTSIELRYKTSRRTDEYGNRFLYRAKVNDSHGAQLSRWAWDVFLVAQ